MDRASHDRTGMQAIFCCLKTWILARKGGITGKYLEGKWVPCIIIQAPYSVLPMIISSAAPRSQTSGCKMGTLFSESSVYCTRHGWHSGAVCRTGRSKTSRAPYYQAAGIDPGSTGFLIHGDLWTGNALADRDGNPAIIDPAAHYGWRKQNWR